MNARFEFDLVRILGKRKPDDRITDEVSEIQRELDAEHARRDRSEKKVEYPKGTLSPRRLSEVNQ